ncbi:MAG TPA: right-handed parallel beta-helix repeat-containing protein [Kofleriaceae bacterium]|nr:right-handed parallel beta-helix repeat-containing protein [Kofleriaceae bacterium]
MVSTADPENTTCGTTSIPCTLINALAAATSIKNTIRIDDDGMFTTIGFTAPVDITIDAHGSTAGATIKKMGTGDFLTVTGNRKVALLGGHLIGSSNGNSGDNGINCTNSMVTIAGTTIEMMAASAIVASNCDLTIARADIHNNNLKSADTPSIDTNTGAITLSQSKIRNNAGGGLRTTNAEKFIIVGNLFLENGTAGGTKGGAVLDADTSVSGNRFDFNTVVENQTQATAVAGVSCSAKADFIALNNIIWNNNSAIMSAGAPAGIQVGGFACAYSDIGPTTPLPPGVDQGHNINMNPNFANEMTDSHPMHGSPIHYQARPTADLTGIASRDIDGNPRVAGPGGVGADLGAYIVPTQ